MAETSRGKLGLPGRLEVVDEFLFEDGMEFGLFLFSYYVIVTHGDFLVEVFLVEVAERAQDGLEEAVVLSVNLWLGLAVSVELQVFYCFLNRLLVHRVLLEAQVAFGFLTRLLTLLFIL